VALRGHLETDFATHVADLTLSNRHFVAKSRRFRRHQLVAKAAFGVFATNGGRRGSDFVAWAAACVPPALRRHYTSPPPLSRPRRATWRRRNTGGSDIAAAALRGSNMLCRDHDTLCRGDMSYAHVGPAQPVPPGLLPPPHSPHTLLPTVTTALIGRCVWSVAVEWAGLIPARHVLSADADS